MEKKEKNAQKLRLLYMAKILLEETDDDHPLTHAEIDEKLAEYGFKKTDRGTFADDIEQLVKYSENSFRKNDNKNDVFNGFEILQEKKGREYQYHVGARTFELAELKTIIDSVQSSRFIPETKSRQLIEKLKTLLSKYEADNINRQVYVSDRIKSENKTNFINVDLINRAIDGKKKIAFFYFDNKVKRVIGKKKNVELRVEKEYRHDKKRYVVSPWNLISNNQNYYLVGSEDGETVRHYRVDRMAEVGLIDEKSELTCFKNIKIADYADKRFNMFDGPEETVMLRISDVMFPIIVDKFGKKIVVDIYDEKQLLVKVKVCISSQFLSWILSLGKEVRVEGPENVKEKMKELLREGMDTYGL